MTRVAEVWTAVFFSFWPKLPVYHAHGDWPRDSKQNAVDSTICGRPTWDAERRAMLGTSLPIQHAEKFGRPCRKCFEEEA